VVHRFACPLCHAPVTADDHLVGVRVKCPHCQRDFIIGAAAETATTDSAPRLAGPGSALRFTFTCQRCGSALEGHSGLCGQLGRCPTCGAVFKVPLIDRRTGLPTGPAEVADDGELPLPMHAYAAAGAKAPSIRRRPDGQQVIVCPQCDYESAIDTDLCVRCGRPFTIEGASQVSVGTASAPNSLATASLVLGILAVPSFCAPVAGVAAIVLGMLALRRTTGPAGTVPGRGVAIAGLICGAISLVFATLYFVEWR
jgi:hypothetical protein